MLYRITFTAILILYLYYSTSNESIINMIKRNYSSSLYYYGLGGMSNIILGYYSTVYLSVITRRSYKTRSLNLLNEYYEIPKLFYTNISFYRYYSIKAIDKNIFVRFKSKKNIALSTCVDLLESCIELCKSYYAKCVFVDIKNKNIIHEVYKLRMRLIKELLIPKKRLIIGVHIRTAIFSDFKENSSIFYNNITEKLYYYAINYMIRKYIKKDIHLYIISDSSEIKIKIKNKYKKYLCKSIFDNRKVTHSINRISVKEQFILSKCDVIIGSCVSTYTLLSVFRYLHEYYSIEGVKYSRRKRIKGKCEYELDYNHNLLSKSLLK